MANNDTIKQLVAGSIQGSIAPLALGLSTEESFFSVNGNTIANIAVKPAVLRMEGESFLNQVNPGLWDAARPFKLKAHGYVVTGASANLQLGLYQVPAAYVADASVSGIIDQSGAVACNSGTYHFYMEARLQWDSTTKKITGIINWQIDGTFEAARAVSVESYSTDVIVNDGDLNFLLSASLSSGNAANVVYLQEFSAQQV